MNDILTARGIVATEPRHIVTETGLAITSFRLASPSRRWDRSSSSWINGVTNWFTVTAFRSLAANTHKSFRKGDRVVVTGRLRVRNWERADRSGVSVEIDAEALGHDLAWGVSQWMRVPRHSSESAVVPGDHLPSVDPHTGEVTVADRPQRRHGPDESHDDPDILARTPDDPPPASGPDPDEPGVDPELVAAA